MTLIDIRSLPDESKLVLSLVCGGEFIHHMYLVFLPPILGILAGEFEVSLALLGIAIGVQGLTNTLFQVPFGYLSDNHSRTLVFTLALGIATVGVFIIALAPSYALLLVGQAVLGIGVAGHHPGHYPLLADATPAEFRARAFSLRGFTGSLGFATPPVFITAVIGLGFTWRHAILAMGLVGGLYGIAATLLFYHYVDRSTKRPADGTGSSAESRQLRERIRAELAALMSSPPILALALVTMLISMAGWGLTSYAVVHLTESYDVGLELANVGLSAMFVAAAVLILVGGDFADRVSEAVVLLGALLLLTIVLFAFASTWIPPLVAVTAVVIGGALRQMTGPPRDKLIDKFSERAQLGQSFAIMTVGMMLGNAIAPPLFGLLGEYVGLSVAFVGIAIVAFLALLLAGAVLQYYSSDSSSIRQILTDTFEPGP